MVGTLSGNATVNLTSGGGYPLITPFGLTGNATLNVAQAPTPKAST